jgi:ATP-binding cassette subfamily A (ABC1) protein 3
MVKAQMAKP